MLKRIMLFLITNLAIVFVLGIVLNLLGVGRILDEQGMGLDLTNLILFAAVFGFGGSLISLAISNLFMTHPPLEERISALKRDM